MPSLPPDPHSSIATPHTAEIVICGAGIAGIAAAWHLAVTHGVRDVLLVDERPPLTLTSDKSTEAYRNWWPGPDDTMIRMMDHSIAWLERWAEMSGNRFLLNRRGYLYASADSDQAAAILQRAEHTAALGAGPLRLHTTPAAPYQPAHPEAYRDQPAGADILCHPELIRRHFGYLNPRTRIVLHARKCGWFSGQQLGMWLLEQGRDHGVRLLRGRVTGVETQAGQVSGVLVQGADGVNRPITTRHFVNAAGPFLKPVAALTGATLPVFSERHLKLSIRDRLGIVPRDAPLLIWEDSQFLPWSADEREWLAASGSDRWLTGRFPPGVHLRPEGGRESQIVLLLWAWHTQPVPEQFPLPPEPLFPELVLRGMTALLPGLAAYVDALPSPWVDGGYYTKAADNRPIVGPLPTPGAWVIGALSGYGLMAAAAAGDLLAAWLTESALPAWAAPLHPARLHDPAWYARVATWGDTAQL